MQIDRNELRKLIHSFNSISSRLLQADFNDFNNVLRLFISFINDSALIKEYIESCGECTQNMEQEFKEVSERAVFDLGTSEAEEVRNVYSILNYIATNDIHIHTSIGFSYSTSHKYQEILKDFNDRITLVLIRYIENYLVNVGIDLGLDDNVSYNVKVDNGQVNIARDNATINAQLTTNDFDIEDLERLIININRLLPESGLSPEELDIYQNSIESIRDISSNGGKKSFLKNAIVALQAIKGSAEFGAALTALIDFLKDII